MLRAGALGVLLLMSIGLVGGRAFAQSTLAEYPTPVFSNEISGRIVPRDVGDPRLTRHFYTFGGTEGDLVVTVESTDLNGSVDLFTGVGLRPLASVTMYATSTPTKVTRSVYLQNNQSLVLRVEGRSAGDAEGVYRMRLEGAFAPASGALASAPEAVAPKLTETARAGRRTKRVNAVGATIEEPEEEKPPTESAAETTTADKAASEPAPETSTEAASTPEPTAGRTTARTAPGRARTPRRGRTSGRASRTPPAAAEAPTPESSDAETAPAPRTTTRRATRAPGRRTTRNRPADANRETDAASASASPPAGEPAPVVTATRLVIETKDGNRIERDMGGVRRVSVENNQVLIVGRDGKTERVPLANVLRMSIEP